MSEREWIEELLKINDEDLQLSEKQSKIIEAAIEVFSEKGFAAASTNEIAKKAGVAEGTIFRHYKTKKELLFSIVTPTLVKVVAPFFAKGFVREVFTNEHQSYEDFLRLLITNRLDFVKKHFPIIKIFLQEIPFHDELKEQYRQVFTENVYHKFTSIVQHFQEKGEIIDFPSDTVIRITMTNIIGYLITRFLVLPEKDWDDAQEIENTIHFLMHGLSPK
ncbi:TetR/AcrR family transcriptional regulator [Caldalkalibacillus mannanilyticus]|uniref:TetR/AcrR family transcriptional regulator n=1 Tax=Caldalkalibacillus mannanilyticus TaxID=1418 RepID=UPI0004688A8B|nr:TetR/AcrR family transcriptional regulator [Caldalkalibacillus mannanilyticus]